MQILVSTVNARFDAAQAGLAPSRCVVVNQLIPEGAAEKRCKRYERSVAARFAACDERRERGVSRSRNRAMELARAEICLLGDDDIVYVPEVCDRVEGAFARFPQADIITFMQKTAPDGVLRKPYPPRPRPHSLYSVWRVGGPEIAFRRSRVREAGLSFDEAFGLGARYGSDEEPIFLADALHKGLALLFVPELISFHPRHSTASRGATDTRLMSSKGAAMTRVYGRLAPLAICAFAARKMVQRRTLSPTLMCQMFRAWAGYANGKHRS